MRCISILCFWWSTSLFEDVSFFSCTIFLGSRLREGCRVSCRFYFFLSVFGNILFFSYPLHFFHEWNQWKTPDQVTEDRWNRYDCLSVFDSFLSTECLLTCSCDESFLIFFKWNPVWNASLRFGTMSPKRFRSHERKCLETMLMTENPHHTYTTQREGLKVSFNERDVSLFSLLWYLDIPLVRLCIADIVNLRVYSRHTTYPR